MGYKSKFYKSGAHLDDTKYVHPKSSWDFSKQEQTATEKMNDSTNKKQTDLPSIKTTISSISRKTNRESIDLGQNEGKIGEGWQNRVNTEALIGESYKDTTAYYNRLLEQKKKQFEAVKPDSNFLSERQRLRYEIDALEQKRDKIEQKNRKQNASMIDWLDSKAGQFNRGVTKTIDVAANAIPILEGAIMGENPDSTFTGQILKPLTDATGKLDDWVAAETADATKLVDETIGDNKALRLASDIAGGVITALPNAALAMMTGGASAGGAIGSQLAPQATGLSGTILSAWNKMVSSPMFQVSFAQTLGNSYDEAKQAGASDMDAMAATLLSTTANAMVEAGGGIETLPGELSGTDLSSGKKALKWLTSALDEGKEEVVQGVISNMVNKAAGTDNRPYFSMTDENAVLNPYRMGQEFGMGAAIGGIMGGGQVLADTVMNRSKSKKSALDFAIEETLKPTTEQSNLDRALESLFEQNKTAQADTGEESTNVNTNPAIHTQREQAVIEEYQNAVDQNLVDFANGVTDGNIDKRARYRLNDVSERAASDILNITGIDTRGFSTTLEGRMIDHIVKRHGANGIADHSMQDMNDIGRIQYVIDNYDRISDGGTSKAYTTNKPNGKPGNAKTVIFEKAVNGTYYVVEAVPDTKAKTTFVVSAYMSKNGHKKAGAKQLTDTSRDAPVFTPENGFAKAPVSSTVSQSGTSVNGKSNMEQAVDALFPGLDETTADMDHGAVGAAESGFSPYSHYQNQTSDFVPEGANAARPVDIPAFDPTGKPVRRGAKTIYGAQTTSDARAEQMESEFMDGLYGYDPVNDKPTLEKAKQTIAQEGYDRAYARVKERLLSMKKLKETGLEAYLLYADAVKNGNDADAAELCLLLTQTGTEFGQGVQLFSMFRKLTPEGQLLGVERMVQRINEKYDGSNISIDENLIEEFRNAADQDTRDAVMEKIYEDIGQKIPTTFAEAANQLRYTAMLLNPSTHIKNMGGNLSMMAMKLGKDAIGAGIEKVANAVTGGKVGRTKSILNVFSRSDQDLMQKAWSDFENVQDDVAGIGKNKDNVMGKVGEYRSYWKLNDPQGNAAKLVDGVLRGAEKVPQFNSNLMEAEDLIFSRPDYAVSLAGYMKANKLTEITPEARAYAIKEAQKATFRDANAVSNFARKIGTGDHKFWNWVASAIFPFKGTPANVGVRAFEYSPAGLLKALTYDIYRVKTGEISATEYIDNLSSGLTGSALAAVGYYLAQAGFLRATGIGDEKEKEQQRQQGYKDNSFTLLGYSIPEMVLTSLSAPMFVGASFYEALATKALSGEAYDWDDIFQVLAATADPILGQTMLDGLSDTFYTIRSAQGGMGEVTYALALNTVGNYISSFMPTILSRISSAADSVGRETYVDKNKQMKGVQKEAQGLMMKTPARQLLHEKVDNYGRVQETWMSDENDGIAEKALKFAANVVTPSYPSKIKTSDVEDELSRLYHSGVDTSDKKVFQTEAAKYIKVDGQKVNLTQDQHEQFEKTRGKNTMEYQGALQENSTYEKLDDELKINATDKMYDFIEQTSKESLNIGYEPEQWVSDLNWKSKEEIADAIMLKTIESYVKSDSFSGKYDGITSMLESGNIDEAMAVSMLPKEAEDGYFNQIKGSGVEISTFIDVYQFKTDARSDYDKDGKTVKSAQEKVIEYINRVEKSPEKKRRLFLSMGYAESKIPEEWK